MSHKPGWRQAIFFVAPSLCGSASLCEICPHDYDMNVLSVNGIITETHLKELIFSEADQIFWNLTAACAKLQKNALKPQEV
ncbi:MAG: hypothetical protein CVV41_13590 [Candidatus Riflebacteria bacterium HGW-Riflebacteria-1]|nr:MAG: hypothetical protein CVV41_13590 [Candidatus Riflebacteria bacterium HGW-Riflebacteria-1]